VINVDTVVQKTEEAFKVEAVEEKDFPKVVRTSAYINIIKKFVSSQFVRGKIDGSALDGTPATIRSALRRNIKKLDYAIDVVVDDKKMIYFRKTG